MTFVKCHHRSVSPIFCVTFHFIPSIKGSHKNNLYHQCQSERRITTSLPPLSEGLIMGWKEPGNRAEPGASWWLSLLMAAWGWIAAHSTLLHLSSFTSLPLFTVPDTKKEGKRNEILKNGGLSSHLFNKRPKRWLNLATRAVESLLNYALLPPWILLMIPHRQSPVIPLWNTLWWNKALCVSSPQYANPGLIMGQP